MRGFIFPTTIVVTGTGISYVLRVNQKRHERLSESLFIQNRVNKLADDNEKNIDTINLVMNMDFVMLHDVPYNGNKKIFDYPRNAWTDDGKKIKDTYAVENHINFHANVQMSRSALIFALSSREPANRDTNPLYHETGQNSSRPMQHDYIEDKFRELSNLFATFENLCKQYEAMNPGKQLLFPSYVVKIVKSIAGYEKYANNKLYSASRASIQDFLSRNPDAIAFVRRIEPNSIVTQSPNGHVKENYFTSAHCLETRQVYWQSAAKKVTSGRLAEVIAREDIRRTNPQFNKDCLIERKWFESLKSLKNKN